MARIRDQGIARLHTSQYGQLYLVRTTLKSWPQSL